jgi:hypothetical protein
MKVASANDQLPVSVSVGEKKRNYSHPRSHSWHEQLVAFPQLTLTLATV